jgi:hypothetical protein
MCSIVGNDEMKDRHGIRGWKIVLYIFHAKNLDQSEKICTLGMREIPIIYLPCPLIFYMFEIFLGG